MATGWRREMAAQQVKYIVIVTVEGGGGSTEVTVMEV